ncbi:cytochrome c oxidase assembly protein [Arthrobacter tumbae]|uniref:cytochrome c oxidase assembly protein n=1 Tax=Arthrobacter tumbae TaxID=163874 RepID=UPI00195BEBD0|nr:cytochrome c oxidase assembly protein [Arthrobacter tumbae]
MLLKQRRHARRWILLGLLTGVLLAALLPVVTTSAPGSDAALGNYVIPATRFILHASLLTAVGLLTTVFLLPSTHRGDDAVVTLSNGAAATAAFSCLTSLILLVLMLSNVLGPPLTDAVNLETMQQFLRELPSASVLLIQAVLLATASLCAWKIRARRGVHTALFLAMAGAATLALGGHSAAAPNHVLATLSLIGHIAAAALWAGGLLGLACLAYLGPGLLRPAIPRFSSVALWCVIVVGISGTTNAVLRVGSLEGLFSSSYGSILLLKISAFLVLIAFGVIHRRRLITEPLTTRRKFLRLVVAELAVMAVAFGLAAALSQANPPAAHGSVPDLAPAQAPTFLRLFGTFHLDAFGLLTALTASALYLAAVIRLRRRGDKWPMRRTVAFSCGIVFLVVVTCTGVGRYALATFSMHMVQHMALNMVAPLFLLLGAPMTLALRALRPPARKALLKAIESTPVRLVTHPIITTAVFITSLYALYFTPLFELAMSNHWGHLAMQAHFLLSGLLFFWFILGIDPGPRKISYAPRVPLLLLVMLAHTVFAMVLVFGNSVLGGGYFAKLEIRWRPSLLEDQALGGALAWLLGELTTVAVLAWIILHWFAAADRSDRAALRGDRYRAAKVDVKPNP